MQTKQHAISARGSDKNYNLFQFASKVLGPTVLELDRKTGIPFKKLPVGSAFAVIPKEAEPRQAPTLFLKSGKTSALRVFVSPNVPLNKDKGYELKERFNKDKVVMPMSMEMTLTGPEISPFEGHDKPIVGKSAKPVKPKKGKGRKKQAKGKATPTHKHVAAEVQLPQ
jgi:hypothetical protein